MLPWREYLFIADISKSIQNNRYTHNKNLFHLLNTYLPQRRKC